MAKLIRFFIAIACLAIISNGQAAKDGFQYLEYPNALPGKIIKVKKKVDKATGRMKLVSNDAFVSTPEDIGRLQLEEEKLRKANTGTLSGTLAENLGTMGFYDREKVVVSMKWRTGHYLDKTRHSMEALR